MQLPDSFAHLYAACFGSDARAKYLASFTSPALRGLRINPLRTGETMPVALRAHKVPWTPDGYYIDPFSGLGKDPLHAAGAYYLQEPSAMAPATALAAKPGEYVLDLCAAPGGKTTQLAAQMQGTGLLVANELDRERCTALAENVERMGVQNALITNLPPQDIASAYLGFFDAVLVDAPCSGEGLFRREEAALVQWSEQYVQRCADLQLEILQHAVRTLKPGGRLVYSTCTINPLENEVTCLRLLAQCPELTLSEVDLPGTTPGFTLPTLAAIAQQWPPLRAALTGVGACEERRASHPPLERTRRILPHAGLGEGHFIACFVQRSDITAPVLRVPQNRVSKRSQADVQWEQVWREEATHLLTPAARAQFTQPGRTMREGGGHTLFATVSGQMPRLTRGVLRDGVALLQRPHQHVFPAHALAMALPPAAFTRTVQLPYGDARVLAYLQGEAITVSEAPDGYVQVSVAGYPLGWGKAVAGVVKNHYPKGLRRPYAFAWSQWLS